MVCGVAGGFVYGYCFVAAVGATPPAGRLGGFWFAECLGGFRPSDARPYQPTLFLCRDQPGRCGRLLRQPQSLGGFVGVLVTVGRWSSGGSRSSFCEFPRRATLVSGVLSRGAGAGRHRYPVACWLWHAAGQCGGQRTAAVVRPARGGKVARQSTGLAASDGSSGCRGRGADHALQPLAAFRSRPAGRFSSSVDTPHLAGGRAVCRYRRGPRYFHGRLRPAGRRNRRPSLVHQPRPQRLRGAVVRRWFTRAAAGSGGTGRSGLCTAASAAPPCRRRR